MSSLEDRVDDLREEVDVLHSWVRKLALEVEALRSASSPSTSDLRAVWQRLRTPGLDFVETYSVAQTAGLDPRAWQTATQTLLADNAIVLTGEQGYALTSAQRLYGVNVGGRTFHLIRFR